MKKTLLLLLSLLIFCVASAQVTTSGMNGKVTDNNGEPLVGTTVIATHTPSGTQYGAVVDNKGSYHLYSLRPGGPYKITFSMIGYQTFERSGLQLALAETGIVDATLKEESIGVETIVITADGKNSSMNSERAGAITNIAREGIEMMPSVNRSMNDIMRLSPQSATTSNGFAVGGGNYRQSYVTVDGAAFNNAFGIGQNLPAGGTPISLDALEQISVSITPFDVRQSGFTGGSINAVTRSGDNTFRGTVYTYLNNTDLKGIHVGDYDLTRSKSQQYTYGASLSGAIIKDKLFVFVNGEFEDGKTAGPTRTARPDENTAWGNDTNFNRPLAADMDKLRNFMIDKYGYDPGRYANYNIKTPGYKIMARIDWNINPNNAVNVRFSHTHTKESRSPSTSTSPLKDATIYPGHGRDGNRHSNYGLYFENSRYYQDRNFTSVAAEWNSRLFDGKGNNMLRFAYSFQHEPRTYDGGLFPTIDILKDGDVYASLGTDVFTKGNLTQVSTYVVTDEFNYKAGINNLMVGLQFEINQAANGYMQAGAGYFVYRSLEDFYADSDPSTSTDQTLPSAFGLTNSNNPNGSQFVGKMQNQLASVYIQDELNIHKNFKLTAGIRFELPIYPSLKNNYNEKFAQRDFGGISYNTAQVPNTRVSVSPRVGFNWDITGDRKYVLRGGTGYFVGRLPFVWLISAVGNSGVNQTTTFYNEGYDKDGNFIGPYKPHFKPGIDDILSSVGFTPTITEPSSPTIIDKNLKMPASWKSSLAFDAKLPGGIDFTLEGIYSKDFHSAVVSNTGYKPWDGETTIEVVPGDKRHYYGAMYSQKEWANPYQNVYMIHNAGNKAYSYSISAQLHKRFDFGLDIMAAYTHSGGKSYGDGIGDQVSSAYTNNTYSQNGNNEHELGYGTYIMPHRVIASLTYRKEYGKHFGTSVALVYDGGPVGYVGAFSYTRYSYTWSSNLVNDYGANNLIFVPGSREVLDSWKFADVKNKDGVITYSAKDQMDDFWTFVNQDKYLKGRKGEYAERGGAVMPWLHRLDFKFAQDFFISTKRGQRNTLTFGVDITNIGNLLNKDWGLQNQVVNSSLLKANLSKDKKTVESINYQQASSRRVDKTFQNYNSFMSTFSVQFSLRYKFN